MKKEEIISRVQDVFAKQTAPGAASKDFDLIRNRLAERRICVSHIDDLKKDLAKWKSSVPTLLSVLPDLQTENAKEAVVRLLSVPFAKSATRTILELYQSENNESLRWAAGNALEVLASDEIAEDLIRLALDKSAGASRQMVVLALGKLESEEAVRAAITNLEDEVVVLHALGALSRMKDPIAISAVLPFLNHKRAVVRKEARKTLERLGKFI